MEHAPPPVNSNSSPRISISTSPSQPTHLHIPQESTSSYNLDRMTKDLAEEAQPNNDGVRASIEISKEDGLHEQSPLLPPRASEERGSISTFSAVNSPDRSDSETWNAEQGTREESKSSCYLFLLTLSFLGLQIAWSVELSNGSPYLLSLGVSKSLLALVWIAGPLSGTLVQPYVGIKSDRCRSRFGKRRPFMVGGAIATIVSLMTLAWTREIVAGFLSIFGVSKDSEGVKTTAIGLAVLMVYILDFSINVIQAGIRAFAVDNAPTHQQDAANAWASRITGVGNIIGYLFGYTNLPRYLWFFGNTQFKVLCVIAALGLSSTVTISCLAVSERDPRLEGKPAEQEGGVFSFFKTLGRSMARLPYQIKAVCYVQLAAWIAWFPFLFYITTYVGQLYVDPIFRDDPNMNDEEIDEAWEHGTRVGTFALLVYAIVSFIASVVLPWLVASSYRPPEPTSRTPMATTPSTSRTPGQSGSGHAASYFDLRRSSVGAAAGAVDFADGQSLKVLNRLNWFGRVGRYGARLEMPWLTLKRAWLLSHLMFAALMWLTFIANNTTTATILVGLIGIPWAMMMWAPFALIAAEVSKRDNIRRGVIRPPPTVEGELLARGEDDSDGADQAGVVLGIHNVAIAAPQVVATLISSVIFKALQKPRGTPGDDSVAWVLRFGGCLAVVAAWLTRRIHEEGEAEGTKAKW
ncbi:hypothetical protein AC578_2171 [Pseudocercospora eumusae]|uniref:General alpha-glucoside permease n=1 Tax=Pseudocercospora eumusae TaxID=321146 RepID=A0A139HHJ1_9PEZI|nr:hypothetical protein AC578_2171 [Pseudocercospora eumusae]